MMGYCIPGTLTYPLPASNSRQLKSLKFSRYTLSASLEKNHIPLIGKKVNKVARRLVRISTAEGKWQGNWNADYNFTLRDLQLDDLVEVGDPKNARVLVSLTIHRVSYFSLFCLVKTTEVATWAGRLGLVTGQKVELLGFGLSVDGTVDTSFTRKCSNCSLPYCRKITSNFNVWVLSTTSTGDSNQLPEIGGDDPSVTLSMHI
nr:hypothetical protein [Tanacetum cinerariifolium]